MSEPEPVMVLFSTAPPAESGELARMLIDRRLVACVNIMPVQSVYMWKGTCCDEGEHLLIMKTVQSRVEEVVAAIRERHSYEVPEVIALPVTAGYPPYLEWVREETR